MNFIKEIQRRGGLREVARRAIGVLSSKGPGGVYRGALRLLHVAPSYQRWIRKFEQPGKEAGRMLNLLHNASQPGPKFSIIHAIDHSNARHALLALVTVFEQIWPSWELICVCSGINEAHKEELDRFAADDLRVQRVLSPNLLSWSESINLGILKASGDWVIVLNAGDFLAPTALLEFAFAISLRPEIRMIYGDEDEINAITLRRECPNFKPDWSPDLLRSCNYLGDCVALKVEDVRSVGGWQPDFERAGSYDLYLRISEKLEHHEIHHVPKVLYHRNLRHSALHRRDIAARSVDAMRALSGHLARTGKSAVVTPDVGLGHFRIRYDLPCPPPRVSIIIPNKNMPNILDRCLGSIHETTVYPDYDVIVVDNGSDHPGLADIYGRLVERGGTLLQYNQAFNFSAMNNLAVRSCASDIVVFLNNDTEVIGPDWLEIMVSHAMQEHVGCVGAKLYYDDDTVQHAGVFVGVGGIACHPYRGASRAERGFRDRLQVTQNLSAVTAACLAVRKSVFEQVGGFDEQHLKISLNDVDLCLRVREAGYDNVWTPHAELYHHESRSRGYMVSAEKRAEFEIEADFFSARWPSYLAGDPYHSPNLDRQSEFVSIRSV